MTKTKPNSWGESELIQRGEREVTLTESCQRGREGDLTATKFKFVSNERLKTGTSPTNKFSKKAMAI